jgi:hypothetical protein
VPESGTLPSLPRSSTDNARNHHNLLRLWVERLNTLGRLARFYFEGRRPPGPLLREYALSLADSGKCLGITDGNFLLIPSHTVVASTGHHS